MRVPPLLTLLVAVLSLAAGRAAAEDGPVDSTSGTRIVREQQGDVTLWRPERVQDGALFLVDVEAPCAAPLLRWQNRSWKPVAIEKRWQGLLPVPLGEATGEERLEVRCPGVSSVVFVVPVFEGMYPDSQLSVDPKFGQRPPARVKDEQAAISAAFKDSAAHRLWQEAFARPAVGVETSPFGVRRVFNGKVDSRHRGLDLDGKVGDLVVAANDGVVRLVSNDFYFVGNAVFLDHGGGLFTMYFHLSRVDVHDGDKVKRGQALGLLGSTGRVTGPHLHFAVKLGGTYVNPADLLRLRPGVLLSQAEPIAPVAGAAAP